MVELVFVTHVVDAGDDAETAFRHVHPPRLRRQLDGRSTTQSTNNTYLTVPPYLKQ